LPVNGHGPKSSVRTPIERGARSGGNVISVFGASGILLGLVGPEGHASGGFIDGLPDPMKPDVFQVGFVIVILVAMFLFLKYAFFKPVSKVMDERDADIAAGSATKHQAAAEIEQRQAEYASRLRELRGQAFDRRKDLAAQATLQKDALIEEARQKALHQRNTAREALQLQQEQAKAQLTAEVDALSESMVLHLLKQA